MDLSKLKQKQQQQKTKRTRTDNSDSESKNMYDRQSTTILKVSSSNEYGRFNLLDESYKFKIKDIYYKSVFEFLNSKETPGFSDMIEGYLAKFRACWDLKRALNGTGNRILVYCEEDEQSLGCGYDENDPNSDILSSWTGKNLLGYALMQVRCEIKEDWKVENLNSDGNIVKKQKKTK